VVLNAKLGNPADWNAAPAGRAACRKLLAVDAQD
jgi:hypothetical protein